MLRVFILCITDTDGVALLELQAAVLLIFYICAFVAVFLRVDSTARVIAKFHYTDTDTDPNGPARTQRSFAAKKFVSVSVSGPCSEI